MDLREIRRIIELVENSAIEELEIEESGARIRVRKGSPVQIAGVPGAVPTAGPIAMIPSAGPAPSAAPAAGPILAAEDTGLVIKSPMVGTFYRSPSPEAPAFVQIGSEVEEETVVCILEAMKVMNEIKSGLRGKIVEVLVENGQPVEFGQPLYRLSPR